MYEGYWMKMKKSKGKERQRGGRTVSLYSLILTEENCPQRVKLLTSTNLKQMMTTEWGYRLEKLLTRN